MFIQICSVGRREERTLAGELSDLCPLPVPHGLFVSSGKYNLSRASVYPSVKPRREVEMGPISQQLSSRHFP